VTKTRTSAHELVRNARRAKGLTQSELAARVKCKQSAVSMFEAGRTNVLAAETIAQIAKILDIDIKSMPAAGAGATVAEARLTLKYCPIDECPSNVPYVVHGTVHLMPKVVTAAEDEKTRCRYCGEILECHCPNAECAARVEAGAFCPWCGAEYVPQSPLGGTDPVAWADAQRRRIAEMRKLAEE
jgi:transcriptional regulator with XRE-family HTH domain